MEAEYASIARSTVQCRDVLVQEFDPSQTPRMVVMPVYSFVPSASAVVVVVVLLEVLRDVELVV